MFSFKSNEGALQNDDSHLSSSLAKSVHLLGARLWTALLGEERPRDMWVLLFLLVLLLHLWLLTKLMQPEEKITQAEPLVMEVSMIAIPAPKKAAVEPAKPVAPPPPPPEKKPEPKPKKIKPPKPVAKKPPPVVQKAPDFAPFEPFEPFKPDVPAPSSKSTGATSASSSSSSTSTSASNNSAPAFTEANFRANYAHNPKPTYPAIARSRNWQGKVLLRVKVSAKGLTESVSVEQSSGHDMLDESAIEAVKKWRFIPAKRGDTPVASSVIVPIDFKLRN